MTAFKKPLCAILAAVFVFAFVVATPLTAFAVEEKYSPEVIELNRKTEGDFDFVENETGSEAEIVAYNGTDADVKVPTKLGGAKVASIGANAFAGNDKVVSVKLNNGILSVGDGVFKNCTALKELSNTSSLTELGDGLFEGCTALESFEIPDPVTSVPARCFADCASLKEVKEHKNIKLVAPDAFVGTAFENDKPDGPLNFGRVLYGVKGNVSDIVVGEGIEIISSGAFIGCDYIKSVTLGEDVTDIRSYAFQNCTGLEKVVFGSAVGILEAGAFKDCSALKEVDFSETTAATIGYECFKDCTSLETVKLCETLSDIGDFAFANTSVKSFSFDKNVSAVGENAFSGDKALESFEVVSKNKGFSATDGILYSKNGNDIICFPASKTGEFTVPAKVKTIKSGAFRDSAVEAIKFEADASLEMIAPYAFENAAVVSVELPESTRTIGNDAFLNASKLASISLNEGITYIGSSAFEGCAALSSVELPSTLKEINSKSFLNAGLTKVVTCDGLMRIDSEAFAGNAKLSELQLGASIKKIGEKAFENCSSLGAVAIPATVVELHANSFDGCSALKAVTVDENSNSFKTVGASVYSKDGKSLIIAGNADTLSLIVAEGTEVIEDGAFNLAANISNIGFPATLMNVKGGALDNTAWYQMRSSGVAYAGLILYKVNSSLASVAVNEGTLAIADGAFAKSAAKTVTLPESLTAIGDGAFAGAAVESAIIPDGVKYIGTGAFEGSALKSVALPASLEKLGNAAFKDCSLLEAVELPETLTALGSDAFVGCSALSSAKLGKLEKIGRYAFGGCVALKSVTLPATLTSLDALSFVGSGLESLDVEQGSALYQGFDGMVLAANDDGEFTKLALYPAAKEGVCVIPATVNEVLDRAFYNCDGLTEMAFHADFKNIGEEAFFDCDSLESIEMPESARKIGNLAFASCDSLRAFKVNSNLTDYADNAFEGCFYFNYDLVNINLADNSGAVVAIFVAIFVVIGVVAVFVYKKKQKKADKEFMEKLELRNALNAAIENNQEEVKETESSEK